jgi:hypothetical protein
MYIAKTKFTHLASNELGIVKDADIVNTQNTPLVYLFKRHYQKIVSLYR